jgi:UPF0716 protein FxsA
VRRFGWAVGAAVVAALVEIAVFIAVVKLIGLAWALLLLVATSVLGGWLVGRVGTRSWRRFRAAVADGRPPGGEVSHGLTGLIGALLLTLPGFVTDLLGALLLVPPVRALARDRIERGAQRWMSPAAAGDLFGPRRVKVKVRRGRAPTQPPAPAPERGTGPPPALEGEIVDDRPHPRNQA